jgi:mono/diheme cytochrome c family protein
MSKRPFIVFGLFAVLCILVIPIWALGKEGDENSGAVQVASDDQEAKSMFATNCGTCHTLAAAGTDGVVGPNLDQLLVPNGTNSAELYEGNATRVFQAIHCGVPPGGSRMPRGILEEEEAREVAQFVSAYAGQIGKGAVVSTDEGNLPEPAPCPQG